MGDGRPIALGRLLRSGRSRRSQDNALWHLSGRHQRPKRDEQLARQSLPLRRQGATTIVLRVVPRRSAVCMRYHCASALFFWNIRKRHANWIMPRGPLAHGLVPWGTRALPAPCSCQGQAWPAPSLAVARHSHPANRSGRPPVRPLAGPRTGSAIEDATQHVRREAIGKGLRALPVVDAQEGSACPGAGRGRHAQIDQAQFGVDEVEVVVQAFAGYPAARRCDASVCRARACRCCRLPSPR